MIKAHLLRSNSGQSLVSVLTSLAISGVVIMIVLQISTEQNKSLKYFTQKSDLIELKNLITEQFASSSVCDWQFRFGNPTIDTTDLASQSKSFTELYMGISNTSPKLVAINTKISGLNVNAITFKNIIATGVPGQLKGEIEIAFDPNAASRPIAPLKIQKFINVNTADPANVRRILGCTINIPSGSHCGAYTEGTTYDVDIPCQGISVKVRCPPGFTPAGGDYQTPGNRKFITCIKN